MKGFISFEKRVEKLLQRLIARPEMHARFLNTLSYLENVGAKKIAACEHPTKVKKEMLKHASEEFRHAHFLKSQIARVSEPLDSYEPHLLIGGSASLFYLDRLDVQLMRYLRKGRKVASHILELSYLLVTYAIELRAEELYRLYDIQLKRAGLQIGIRSIFLEELEHLAEMQRELARFEAGESYLEQALSYEAKLCERWLNCIEAEIAEKR